MSDESSSVVVSMRPLPVLSLDLLPPLSLLSREREGLPRGDW